MKLADLHCDTPYKLYKSKEQLQSNTLHISLDKVYFLQRYVQVSAIWSSSELSDNDAFSEFQNIHKYFPNDYICKTRDELINADIAFILAIEDMRLLDNDPSRIEALYNKGIRIGTLTWKGLSIIGGAWNTGTGLTDFGIEAVYTMLEKGIIPDVSHGSRCLIKDTCRIAKELKRPLVATHSNSYAIHPHKRNLTDCDARQIAECDGIIGVSLYPPHLGCCADINTIVSHITHYVNIIGEDHIALGCDFDGVDCLPEGVSDITSTERIYTALSRRIGSFIADKILFDNAYNFLLNIL